MKGTKAESVQTGTDARMTEPAFCTALIECMRTLSEAYTGIGFNDLPSPVRYTALRLFNDTQWNVARIGKIIDAMCTVHHESGGSPGERTHRLHFFCMELGHGQTRIDLILRAARTGWEHHAEARTLGTVTVDPAVTKDKARITARASGKPVQEDKPRAKPTPVFQRPIGAGALADALKNTPAYAAAQEQKKREAEETARQEAAAHLDRIKCRARTGKAGNPRCKNDHEKGSPFCGFHFYARNRKFGTIDEAPVQPTRGTYEEQTAYLDHYLPAQDAQEAAPAEPLPEPQNAPCEAREASPKQKRNAPDDRKLRAKRKKLERRARKKGKQEQHHNVQA